MRLNEITDYYKRSKVKKKIKGRGYDPFAVDVDDENISLTARHEDMLPVDRPPLGKGGVQGAAWDHGPGTVIKQAYITGPHDPYLQFIKIIEQHQDNPFFPKIYSSNMVEAEVEGKDPEDILVLKMEKLHPITHPKLRSSAKRIYQSLGFELTPQDERTIAAIKDRDPNITIKILNNKMKGLFKGQRPKEGFDTLNPQFVEALRILGPLVRKLGSDMHEGNMMFRLTSVGPQLVILDPVLPKFEVKLK